MTDVALSILALIAGGLTLELFTSASPLPQPEDFSKVFPEPLEEFPTGNPS
jgi:hypothetical protein